MSDELTADICALGKQGDYVRFAIHPKDEDVRRVRLSVGGAENLLAELLAALGVDASARRDRAAFLEKWADSTDALLKQADADFVTIDQVIRHACTNSPLAGQIAYIAREAMARRRNGDGGGWLPITTAPKDGTVVDLWFAKALRPHRKAGFFWCSDNRSWAEDGYQAAPWRDRPCVCGEPTHWRLIPGPPLQSSECDRAKGIRSDGTKLTHHEACMCREFEATKEIR